jgi:hypothetical protein
LPLASTPSVALLEAHRQPRQIDRFAIAAGRRLARYVQA